MMIMAGKKVLILDDEINILEILDDILSLEGFEVTTANNGNDALIKYSNQEFDLIISDIKMPVMNGVEFLKKCQEIKEIKKFVFMTGFAEVSEDEAIKLGADKFFMKPLDLDAFVQEISQLVN